MLEHASFLSTGPRKKRSLRQQTIVLISIFAIIPTCTSHRYGPFPIPSSPTVYHSSFLMPKRQASSRQEMFQTWIQIRGGGDDSDDEINTPISDDTESPLPTIQSMKSSRTRPWSPLKSAFQMNLDAKEELIHDRLLIQSSNSNGSSSSSNSAAASSLALGGGGGGGVSVTPKQAVVYKERRTSLTEEKKEEEEWGNSIRKEDDVLTASSRLLVDSKIEENTLLEHEEEEVEYDSDDTMDMEEYPSDEEEEVEEEVYEDALSEEYQGSFVVQNDSAFRREMVHVEEKEHEGDDVESEESSPTSELKPVKEKQNVEDSSMDVNSQTISKDNKESLIVNQEEDEHEIEPMDSMTKDVEETEIIPTEDGWQVLDNTQTMAIDSTLEEASMVEENSEENYASTPSRESIEAIVYEEWRDIETDVTDVESYSVKVEKGRNKKKEKKNNGKNKKRNSKKDKAKEKRREDDYIQTEDVVKSSKSAQSIAVEEPNRTVVRDKPLIERQSTSSPPMAPKEGLANQYISSGWVSISSFVFFDL